MVEGALHAGPLVSPSSASATLPPAPDPASPAPDAEAPLDSPALVPAPAPEPPEQPARAAAHTRTSAATRTKANRAHVARRSHSLWPILPTPLLHRTRAAPYRRSRLQLNAFRRHMCARHQQTTKAANVALPITLARHGRLLVNNTRQQAAKEKARNSHELLTWYFDGAPGPIRTADTRFRRAVLYPLSYGGIATGLLYHSARRRQLTTGKSAYCN